MIPQTSIRTGGEIDTPCTRCALLLAHTILAMVGPKVVRVKCNTCGSEHAYKGDQPLMKSQSLAKPRKAGKKPAVKGSARATHSAVAYEDQFRGKDVTRARKFSIKDTYVEGDVIDHPTFGFGLVAEVRPDNKVEVSFKEGVKTLMHGKGGPSADANRSSFAPPRAHPHGYADKVPAGEPGGPGSRGGDGEAQG